MAAELVTNKGEPGLMPVVFQAWGLPMIPSVGIDAGSFQALPVLPVYITTWKEPDGEKVGFVFQRLRMN